MTWIIKACNNRRNALKSQRKVLEKNRNLYFEWRPGGPFMFHYNR